MADVYARDMAALVADLITVVGGEGNVLHPDEPELAPGPWRRSALVVAAQTLARIARPNVVDYAATAAAVETIYEQLVPAAKALRPQRAWLRRVFARTPDGARFVAAWAMAQAGTRFLDLVEMAWVRALLPSARELPSGVPLDSDPGGQETWWRVEHLAQHWWSTGDSMLVDDERRLHARVQDVAALALLYPRLSA